MYLFFSLLLVTQHTQNGQVYNEKNAISHRNKFHDQVTYVSYVDNELVIY